MISTTKALVNNVRSNMVIFLLQAITKYVQAPCRRIILSRNLYPGHESSKFFYFLQTEPSQQDTHRSKFLFFSGYAIPAVNCVSSSGINACLEAARKNDAPIIIQFSSGGSQVCLHLLT